MTEQKTTDPAEDALRHAQKMAKKKAARDKIMATKTEEKGLVIVHTGKGKGKSTAAFGMIFRAIGNGMRVGVVQFVKGKWGTGERKVLEAFPDIYKVKCLNHTRLRADPDDPNRKAAQLHVPHLLRTSNQWHARLGHNVRNRQTKPIPTESNQQHSHPAHTLQPA